MLNLKLRRKGRTRKVCVVLKTTREGLAGSLLILGRLLPSNDQRGWLGGATRSEIAHFEKTRAQCLLCSEAFGTIPAKQLPKKLNQLVIQFVFLNIITLLETDFGGNVHSIEKTLRIMIHRLWNSLRADLRGRHASNGPHDGCIDCFHHPGHAFAGRSPPPFSLAT